MGGKSCKSYSITRRSASQKLPSTGGSPDQDYITSVVCQESEISENQMKLLELKDGTETEVGKILLIKQKGQLHAIGTKCTHYGALLHTGALGDGRIRCPWHGACFNIKTGDIEDYPGLDSLPCYKVTLEQGQVIVQARRKDLDANRRLRTTNINSCSASRSVVIIGGGPAGATCADTLRQEGFAGRILMICKEPVLPYDRIKVSKMMDFDVSKSLLRNQNYYDEHNIETKLDVEAVELDTDNKTVTLSSGERISYSSVFLATGSKPRMPSVPGTELSNVFLVRTQADAARINSQLSQDKHVIVLGQSFIGMEAAAYCQNKVASVTVVGRDTVPLRAVFGEEIGTRILKEHQAKGVKFVFNNNIAKFLPKEQSNDLGTVELTDGTKLQADVAIVGIGSSPYTDWLKGSKVLMQDGAVVVDEFLKSSVDDVYAGGDIAYAPVFVSGGAMAAIGHYPLAHYHGRIAALNICQKVTPLKAVPYFWTNLFGKNYRYAGHGRASSVKIFGSLEDFKFFAYYLNDGKVIAMSSAGSDPIVSDFAEYIYEGNVLTEQQIEDNPIGWMRNKPVELLRNIFKDKFDSLNKSFCKGIGLQKEPMQKIFKKEFHTLTHKHINSHKSCTMKFLHKFIKLRLFRPI
ncbi:apoptosis-inducing factor 3-like [Cotesia glomerata]|nr:apoptosis-inducing factor 3-like [Cotesia glomerata]